jgi:hypothetical protein
LLVVVAEVPVGMAVVVSINPFGDGQDWLVETSYDDRR